MNRAAIARASAGLTLGQAAKLLGWATGPLHAIEIGEGHPPTDEEWRKLADLYHVRIEWLRGDGEQRDYKAVDAMPGSEHLTNHDRDIIAEFAASMPRRRTP